MIHQFKNNGLNIVLDINSGAVHVVDDIVYDIINIFEKNKEEVKEEICKTYEEASFEEAYKEIEQLISDGVLFTEDDYHDTMNQFISREPVVKALCLHIAHDCNLRCKYCFAGEGEYHGDKSLMSLEVGKKSIDFLIENSKNRRNLEVDFFGGEPLMNFQVVKDIVSYARSKEKKYNKNFRFTLTTNGIALNDEIQAYVNENMHNVVLSIDGRKEVNDMMRPTDNGKGTYDIIMPKFKKLAESRNQDNYYVRGTFTRNNLDFSKDVLHLADEGFKQISVEPVVGGVDKDYSLREVDLEVICEEYDKLAKEMIKRDKEGKGFNFFHFMIDLNQGPCVAKRIAGCGSGSEYMAVTPWGDLYPCHQYVGLEEFKLGDLDKGIQNTEKQECFKNCNVYNKPKCLECWAKFYCSGGCSANGYQFHGDINAVYDVGCEMEKKRVECAIMIKAKQLDNNLD